MGTWHDSCIPGTDQIVMTTSLLTLVTHLQVRQLDSCQCLQMCGWIQIILMIFILWCTTILLSTYISQQIGKFPCGLKMGNIIKMSHIFEPECWWRQPIPCKWTKCIARTFHNTSLRQGFNLLVVDYATYLKLKFSSEPEPQVEIIWWDDYCLKLTKKSLQGNPSKPITSCLSTDELGFTRPIFIDRLCDGHPDCPKGEDEGKLAKCRDAGEPTPNGCCRYPIIGKLTKGPIKCAYTGKSNDSGWFSNKNWTRLLIGWVLFKLENRL